MSKRAKGRAAGFVVAMLVAGAYWLLGVDLRAPGPAPRSRRPAPPAAEESGDLDGRLLRVERVIDGDTVELVSNGDSIIVRVVGIDTPETVHPRRPIEPGGPEASARARVLLAGQAVVFRYDPDERRDRTDRYGRVLGFLELPDGRDYGLVMIQEGHAVAYTRFRFSRQAEYVEAERRARE